MSRKKSILLWALAALFLAALPQLFLPGFVARRIEDGLAASFGSARSVEARVRAFPAVSLLFGRVDSVDLDIRQTALSGLEVDSLLLTGRNVRVDMPGLLFGRGVDVRSADAFRAALVVSEAALNEYLAARFPGSTAFRVRLEPGRAQLVGSVNLLGRAVDLRVGGTLQIVGDREVAFFPDEASLENAALPPALLAAATRDWGIAFQLDQDEFPLIIDAITVEDGRLILDGRHPLGGSGA